jgi:hypothetical protein
VAIAPEHLALSKTVRYGHPEGCPEVNEKVHVGGYEEAYADAA